MSENEQTARSPKQMLEGFSSPLADMIFAFLIKNPGYTKNLMKNEDVSKHLQAIIDRISIARMVEEGYMAVTESQPGTFNIKPTPAYQRLVALRQSIDPTNQDPTVPPPLMNQPVAITNSLNAQAPDFISAADAKRIMK